LEICEKDYKYIRRQLNTRIENLTKTVNMTPSTAIKLTCKWCMGGVKSARCDSQICELNNRTLSRLKRIKQHCLDCVETRGEVKVCTSKLFFEDRLCYLHPYRLGHNPKRKGMGNRPGNLKNLQKTRTHDMVLAPRN